jgi:hypothetical protein
MFKRLVSPKLPPCAIGIEKGSASVVNLERRRRGFGIKRAATMTLTPGLVNPSFEERNISDQSELCDALSQLVMSAGLGKRRNWSVALPEVTTRSLILSLDTAVSSRKELEEVLRWKTERGFGVPLDQLRVTRDRLRPDSQGKPRYLMTAVHLSVLDEYETVFSRLGWHAGLIVPRHLAESQWLMNGKLHGDALLVSSHQEGFTAVMMRGAHHVILRTVTCDAEDCSDELYRLLLFYRDRSSGAVDGANGSVEHLLVVGEAFDPTRVTQIVNETLGSSLHALGATDFGLSIPNPQLSFDSIAAPAGLATMAWT